MSWPTSTDYQEAMQTPRTALGDPELQQGKAEEDLLGLPRPISGGFATVYKVVCAHRTWAVRCFLKEFKDQQRRYAEISAQLAISRFSFTTQFQYVERGICVRGSWYPVVKMEWIQGEGLHRFVEGNLASPQRLLGIGQDIVDFARVMNHAGVAHGDLQHGNILVASGKPKLIDYDGMYVPAMQGWRTHEAGHPNYQLLRDDVTFGPGLDNFSVWVIYLSLRALSVRPSLWKQFDGGDDCLLFRRKDYEMPAQSGLLQELKGMPEVRQLVSQFEALLSCHPLRVPFIEPGVATTGPAGKGRPAWLEPPPQPTPQPAPDAFAKLWAPVDAVPRPSNLYSRPFVPAATHGTPWPPNLPCAIPAQPVAPAILSALPPWPGPKGLPTIPPPPTRPEILLSPATWPGPTGLPFVPPKPAVPEILTSPPPLPAMMVPPSLRPPKPAPVCEEQKFIGRLALVVGVLVPIGFFVCLVVAVAAGSSRYSPLVALLGLLPLVGFGVLGMTWCIMELSRREAEMRGRREYEDELARLRAEAGRRWDDWEADLAEEQNQAQQRYDQEFRAWREADSRRNAEAQHQKRRWEQEHARRKEEAQQRYDQDLNSWNAATAPICAEAQRQRCAWESEQARRRDEARQHYEQACKIWQNTVNGIQAEARRRREAVQDAKRQRDAAELNWLNLAIGFVNDFDKTKGALQSLKSEYDNIDRQREDELKQMLARARASQFEWHLREHRIEDAAIEDIGPARKARLQAYGLRTALDMTHGAIDAIPGFGPGLTKSVMDWRRTVEASFIFITSQAIPPHEMQIVGGDSVRLPAKARRQHKRLQASPKHLYRCGSCTCVEGLWADKVDGRATHACSRDGRPGLPPWPVCGSCSVAALPALAVARSAHTTRSISSLYSPVRGLVAEGTPGLRFSLAS
jgi:hypothetical protein